MEYRGCKTKYGLAVCICSPEGQLYLRLHQKCNQQVKGGDSVFLLCSHETPPEVLRSVLRPLPQERHGPVGASPEEGPDNDQKAGSPPTGSQAERVGVV